MEDQGIISRNDSLCDEDLEAQMYAMVHYSTDLTPGVTVSDITSTNNITEQSTSVDIDKIKENNASRYWKEGIHSTQKKDSVYSKVNIRKEDKDRFKEEDLNESKNNTKDTPNLTPLNTKSKFLIKEKNQIDSVFQLPIMENAVITIELLKNDSKYVVTLESSDDDDVIEVELPPKPTICIESSDDEELQPIQAIPSPVNKSLSVVADDKTSKKNINEKSKSKSTESCSSPVPSVVSSVSDDFIRGDCVALNISSHSQENYNFNFNLHGTDLVDDTQNNSLTSKAKKKKNKQKQKEKLSSSSVTPNKSVPVHNIAANSTPQLVSSTSKECFVTPKSKVASKKRVKSKANIPDSLVKGPEKLLNVPEDQSIRRKQVHEQTFSFEPSLNIQCSTEDNALGNSTTIDLTDKADVSFSDSDLIITNIVGQVKSKTSSENSRNDLIEEFKNRRKMYNPPLLNLDIDFEFHPFGCKETNRYKNETRVYSIESCVNDMDKFYNMSWGGEDFDHIQILKDMPRDKGLWHIDPSDRIHHNKRRTACHTCNRFGHRNEHCPWKQPKCFMCGLVGHWETRCPYKICLNCGSKNHLYTSMCRNCSNWGKTFCNTCSNYGHPTTRCPDHWRRYHLTIDNINELTFTRTSQEKPRINLHCSGCSQRGHILNHCRNFMPFNSYCPATPFIANYIGNPMYLQAHLKNIPSLHHDQNIITPRTEKRKWEGFTSSTSTANLKHQTNLNPNSTKYQNLNTPFKNNDENSKSKSENSLEIGGISPNNAKNQKKTYILQDNEVSNTDNAIMTAKMLLTKDYSTKLSTPMGLEFLKLKAMKYNIEISNNGNELNIKGTGENQVKFQTAVREWLEVPMPALGEGEITCDNIPKKGAQIVVKLKKALQYLKLDIGDPKEIHKEYKRLEKMRRKILKEKNVGQKKLKNIRNKLNAVVKNLNMILLGQAGLADGSMHLNELYTLRDILQRSNSKVSPDMRAKVAKHYNAIFSPVHRTDYDVLISKYYESRHEKSKRLQIYSPHTTATAHTPNIINLKPTAVALVPKMNSGECEQRLHVLLSRLNRCCVALQGAVLKCSESVQRRNNFINQLKKFEYPAIRYGMTLAKKRQLSGLLMEIDNTLPLLK